MLAPAMDRCVCCNVWMWVCGVNLFRANPWLVDTLLVVFSVKPSEIYHTDQVRIRNHPPRQDQGATMSGFVYIYPLLDYKWADNLTLL